MTCFSYRTCTIECFIVLDNNDIMPIWVFHCKCACIFIIFIDNFTALRELYLMDNDPIQTICQNGITYGISVVVANSQTSGVSYQYLSNFSTRIALYCNNSTEYHVLFEKCNLKLHDIPGRGIVEANNKFYHCQMYRSFNGEKEVDQCPHTGTEHGGGCGHSVTDDSGNGNGCCHNGKELLECKDQNLTKLGFVFNAVNQFHVIYLRKIFLSEDDYTLSYFKSKLLFQIIFQCTLCYGNNIKIQLII